METYTLNSTCEGEESRLTHCSLPVSLVPQLFTFKNKEKPPPTHTVKMLTLKKADTHTYTRSKKMLHRRKRGAAVFISCISSVDRREQKSKDVLAAKCYTNTNLHTQTQTHKHLHTQTSIS